MSDPTHELHGAYIVPTPETQVNGQARLRVEWQVQDQNGGILSYDLASEAEGLRVRDYHRADGCDPRLIRRVWRLASEEVVE
jgi:hypothetical protein